MAVLTAISRGRARHGWERLSQGQRQRSFQPLLKAERAALMAERALRCKGQEVLVLGNCNSLCTQGSLFLPLCCKFCGCFPFAYLRGMFPVAVFLQTGIPSFCLICFQTIWRWQKGLVWHFSTRDFLFWWFLVFACILGRSLVPGQSAVLYTEHIPSAETGGLHKCFRIKPPNTLAKHRYPTSPKEF